MTIQVIKAQTRGHLNHGWLDTYHTFSFGEYYNSKRMNFGALRVLNDDFIAPGGNFPMHHHENMEIISVILDGTIQHQDSLGNIQTITKGEVQVMSAGTGIWHSETNPSDNQELNLFQIWIYPNQKGLIPSYQQKSFADIQSKNKWKLLVAPTSSRDNLYINQDAFISYGEFDPELGSQEYKLHKDGNGVFIMIIEGSAIVNGIELGNRDAITISPTDILSCNFKQLTKLIVIEVPLNFTH